MLPTGNEFWVVIRTWGGRPQDNCSAIEGDGRTHRISFLVIHDVRGIVHPKNRLPVAVDVRQVAASGYRLVYPDRISLGLELVPFVDRTADGSRS